MNSRQVENFIYELIEKNRTLLEENQRLALINKRLKKDLEEYEQLKEEVFTDFYNRVKTMIIERFSER